MALLQRRCDDAQHQARALAQASLNSVKALLNVSTLQCSMAHDPLDLLFLAQAASMFLLCDGMLDHGPNLTT